MIAHALADQLGAARQPLRHRDVAILLDRPGRPSRSLALREAGALEQRDVVRRVVRHHERGRGVEPVHQEPALVVDGEGGGPSQHVVAAGAAPAGGRVEERVGHGLVVDGLEEAEEADPVAVGLVVQAVADGGDAADDLAVALGQEVLGLGVLEEGVLLAGEEQLHVPTQRRDPERVPRVEPVGQVDEALEVSPVARRADAQPARSDDPQLPADPRELLERRSRSARRCAWP